MIGDEFNAIVMQGEFSEPLDLLIELDSNITYTFDEQPMLFEDATLGVFYDFPIKGIHKKGWKRSVVDGVLTTKIPREATTFTISRDSLPDYIIDNNKIGDVLFRYDNIIWNVIYVIGTDILSFMVAVDDDLLTDETIDGIDDEIENIDAPGLV